MVLPRACAEISAIAAVILLAGAFVLYHVVHMPVAGLLVNMTLGVSAVWLFALLPLDWTGWGWHRILEFLRHTVLHDLYRSFPDDRTDQQLGHDRRGGLPMSGWLAVGGAIATLGGVLARF